MVQLATRRGSDRAQFEAIYLGHHAFVGRCLARLGVRPAALDDARQDVFLTAFRRLHSYAGDASMRAWLAGIARRVAWRHRRTRDRHQRKVDALAEVRVEAGSLERWVQTREAQAVLDAFIDRLDPPKREAFVLCELEGLSAREAATATGVNQATLYSRLRVARSSFASLCATLEPDGEAVAEHAAAIHRQAYQENRRAAARGWLLLAPKLASGGLIAKPLVIAALGLGTLGITTVAAVAQGQPEPAPIAAPQAARVATAAPSPARLAPPDPPAPPMAIADAPVVEPPPVPQTPAPAKRPSDTLPVMVEQLDDAQRRLRTSDWSGAAQAAEAHLTRWPQGPLVRDALRVAVQARCALGERDHALELARAHLASDDVDSWMEHRCKKSPPPVMKPKATGD